MPITVHNNTQIAGRNLHLIFQESLSRSSQGDEALMFSPFSREASEYLSLVISAATSLRKKSNRKINHDRQTRREQSIRKLCPNVIDVIAACRHR
jgi:hypothetical protein